MEGNTSVVSNLLAYFLFFFWLDERMNQFLNTQISGIPSIITTETHRSKALYMVYSFC